MTFPVVTINNFINISFNFYIILFLYSTTYNGQVYHLLDNAIDQQACFQLLCRGMVLAFILLSLTHL